MIIYLKDKNTIKKAKVEFLDDKVSHGAGIVYYLPKLEYEGEWNNNEFEGYGKTYYENGNIQSKGRYDDRKYVGLRHPTDVAKKEGLWEFYWVNGDLKEKGNFKDGKREGLWEQYYDNTKKLNFMGSYKNGKKDGKWTI